MNQSATRGHFICRRCSAKTPQRTYDCDIPIVCNSCQTDTERAAIAEQLVSESPTTATYTNSRESAEVILDGECLGVHRAGKTCVRKTTDNRFAVISTVLPRLIKVFPDSLHARRYNFAIHGEKL